MGLCRAEVGSRALCKNSDFFCFIAPFLSYDSCRLVSVGIAEFLLILLLLSLLAITLRLILMLLRHFL